MQKIRKFLQALSEKNLGQMLKQTNQLTLGIKDAVKRFDQNCFFDFGIQELLTWYLQYQVGLDFFFYIKTQIIIRNGDITLFNLKQKNENK